MTKARDLANLGNTATTLATDSEVSAAVAAIPTTADATPTASGKVFGKTLALTGSRVTAFGYNQYNALTGGERNTFLGFNNAADLTTGYRNVSVGYEAGLNISTGYQNTAVGYSAGAIDTGNSNTVVGSMAGENLYGANNCTAMGAYALSGTGGSATYSNNTGLGYRTGYSGYSLINSTLIGAEAGSTGTDSNNNITCIGYNAQPSTSSVSNQITLGNSSISTIRAQVTSITALSDKRDKKDIEPLNLGTDFVKELKPVSFTWNMRQPETSPVDANGNPVIVGKVDVPDVGFIAQDLVALEDSLGLADALQLTMRDNPDRLEATPGRLIPILVKAIQELTARVEALEAATK